MHSAEKEKSRMRQKESKGMNLVSPVQNAAGLKIFIGRNIHIKRGYSADRRKKKTFTRIK